MKPCLVEMHGIDTLTQSLLPGPMCSMRTACHTASKEAILDMDRQSVTLHFSSIPVHQQLS